MTIRDCGSYVVEASTLETALTVTTLRLWKILFTLLFMHSVDVLGIFCFTLLAS